METRRVLVGLALFGCLTFGVVQGSTAAGAGGAKAAATQLSDLPLAVVAAVQVRAVLPYAYWQAWRRVAGHTLSSWSVSGTLPGIPTEGGFNRIFTVPGQDQPHGYNLDRFCRENLTYLMAEDFSLSCLPGTLQNAFAQCFEGAAQALKAWREDQREERAWQEQCPLAADATRAELVLEWMYEEIIAASLGATSDRPETARLRDIQDHIAAMGMNKMMPLATLLQVALTAMRSDVKGLEAQKKAAPAQGGAAAGGTVAGATAKPLAPVAKMTPAQKVQQLIASRPTLDDLPALIRTAVEMKAAPLFAYLRAVSDMYDPSLWRLGAESGRLVELSLRGTYAGEVNQYSRFSLFCNDNMQMLLTSSEPPAVPSDLGGQSLRSYVQRATDVINAWRQQGTVPDERWWQGCLWVDEAGRVNQNAMDVVSRTYAEELGAKIGAQKIGGLDSDTLTLIKTNSGTPARRFIDDLRAEAQRIIASLEPAAPAAQKEATPLYMPSKPSVTVPPAAAKPVVESPVLWGSSIPKPAPATVSIAPTPVSSLPSKKVEEKPAYTPPASRTPVVASSAVVYDRGRNEWVPAGSVPSAPQRSEKERPGREVPSQLPAYDTGSRQTSRPLPAWAPPTSGDGVRRQLGRYQERLEDLQARFRGVRGR